MQAWRRRCGTKAFRTMLLAAALGSSTAMTATSAAGGASPEAKRTLNIVAGVDEEARVQASPSSAQTAYLLVYFKEHVHSLHFATSRDGFTFTDVNDGKPVLLGEEIAEQKGIRDPYLMRGPDGAFYMTMTDLHIYAKQEGLRTTAWQRPELWLGEQSLDHSDAKPRPHQLDLRACRPDAVSGEQGNGHRLGSAGHLRSRPPR
ncbi:hypothetical protein AB5I41_27685 [Sphingomonas sp. MMS24-JH45]